jgi:citrate lyase beta subunit
MGFDGKWCIHPSQIETVNRTFVPSAKDIEWAQTVLREYEARSARGQGRAQRQGKDDRCRLAQDVP